MSWQVTCCRFYPEWPAFGRRRSTSEPQIFSITTGVEAWTLTSTPNGTPVVLGASDNAPVISAPTSWLALAVYGRVRVDDPEFQVHGPTDSADRFAAIFGPKSSFRSSVRLQVSAAPAQQETRIPTSANVDFYFSRLPCDLVSRALGLRRRELGRQSDG